LQLSAQSSEIARSDPSYPDNPPNPDETSVSVASPSGFYSFANPSDRDDCSDCSRCAAPITFAHYSLHNQKAKWSTRLRWSALATSVLLPRSVSPRKSSPERS